jgi:hypothetical protein
MSRSNWMMVVPTETCLMRTTSEAEYDDSETAMALRSRAIKGQSSSAEKRDTSAYSASHLDHLTLIHHIMHCSQTILANSSARHEPSSTGNFRFPKASPRSEKMGRDGPSRWLLLLACLHKLDPVGPWCTLLGQGGVEQNRG